MPTHDAPLIDYELFHHKTKLNPYALYERMRQQGPIQWHTVYRLWCVVDYELARQLLTAPELSSHVSPHLKATTFPKRFQETVTPLMDLFSRWFIFMDPPQHTVLRKILLPFFNPSAVGALEAKFRHQVNHVLDRWGDSVDLITQLAHPLPIWLITELLGLPHKQAHRFRRWNHCIAEFMEAFIRTPQITRHALHAVSEQKQYLQKKIGAAINTTTASSGHSDFIVRVYQDLEQIQPEWRSHYWCLLSLLLGAGAQTSEHVIGNMFYLLLSHPKQLRLLQRDPDTYCEPTIAEALRYQPPIQSVLRVAKQNICIANQKIKVGEYIRIFIAAANRDPAVFSRASCFDIQRHDAKKIADLRGGGSFLPGTYVGASYAACCIARGIEPISFDSFRRSLFATLGSGLEPTRFESAPRSAVQLTLIR